MLTSNPPRHLPEDAGFHDQAHLTKHFKRHVGTTPAAYGKRDRVA